jgi:Xaa-Pro dipeptidase
MTIGVGGSSAKLELVKFTDMTKSAKAIGRAEFEKRIEKAIYIMKSEGFDAVYLHAGTNLYYFTGTKWYPSERMVGAILTTDGDLNYIGPKFEEGTINNFMLVEGKVHCWEEHENPYELFGKILSEKNIKSGKIGIDESAAFFITDGIRLANSDYNLVNAKLITAGCRSCKSDAEIALLQQAKNITIEVHKAAARILRPGITVKEVTDFINNAHIKAGIPSGSYFCIVLFAEDSQFPHGVPKPQPLKENEIVLIDTGCQLHGYISDITRTYVYGEPNDRHREIWNLEKAAQKAAFEAAKIGASCSSVDNAARKVLKKAGLGPDYELPGLPHRVGHGTGLDIHEYPYLVRSDQTKLQKGMVFSNEPMICLPGEFGIRHEDHFYMTDSGAKWFTEPMHSIDDPFGYEK